MIAYWNAAYKFCDNMGIRFDMSHNHCDIVFRPLYNFDKSRFSVYWIIIYCMVFYSRSLLILLMLHTTLMIYRIIIAM
jgi:hypothetical protein